MLTAHHNHKMPAVTIYMRDLCNWGEELFATSYFNLYVIRSKIPRTVQMDRFNHELTSKRAVNALYIVEIKLQAMRLHCFLDVCV